MRVEYDTTIGFSGNRRWREPSDLPPESMPSRESLHGYITAFRDPTVRQNLYRERGINPAFAEEYGIGWDGSRGAWVLRSWNRWGALVNVTWRPPRGQAMRWKGRDVDKPRRLAGRTAENGELPLWPDEPSGDAWLLTAGEWDALAALQAGLPALTGLLGCQWHRAWNDAVIGKRIAIAFDLGEERAAASVRERLLSAGAADAWVIDLGRLGLNYEGADLCDYFYRGGTRRRLLRVISEARDAR